MNGTIALVLGGGRGLRLFPLTKHRAKPAVPLAGKYRLIDIPLSNCINSRLKSIYVLTQFLSVSLHRHIRDTYRFDHFTGGFVEILAAQQTTAHQDDWYQGTADAVRKNLRYIKQPGVEHVLILSGDQLYRMNFAEMMATHRQTGADVTICAKPVARREAGALGIMRVDESGRVVGFLEKPQTDQEIDMVRMDPAWIDAQGTASRGRECLASMGIYLFNRSALVDALEKTDYQDFGREVFPASFRTRRVQVHLFEGYWEDIGTIGSFFEANLALVRSVPPFELTHANAPIYSRPRYLPPTRLDGARVERSLIADGSLIEPGAVIEESIVGLRCRIGRDVVIRNSVLMGADDYETPDQLAACRREGRPPVGIGQGTVVERAIVDKNCRIGAGIKIVGSAQQRDCDYGDTCHIRDGIVVVEKEATLSDGWRLE